MAVVESAGAQDLLGFLESVCARGTTVVTDGWSSYARASEAGFDHVRLVEGRAENASELFPLLHTLFANMKVWINGTFHGVRKTWLPAYVREFAYRLNRRAHNHAGQLWSFVHRRVVRGAWCAWRVRDAEMESRRAA